MSSPAATNRKPAKFPWQTSNTDLLCVCSSIICDYYVIIAFHCEMWERNSSEREVKCFYIPPEGKPEKRVYYMFVRWLTCMVTQVPRWSWPAVSAHHAGRWPPEVPEGGAGCCQEAGRHALAGHHWGNHHVSPEARPSATQQVRRLYWSDCCRLNANHNLFYWRWKKSESRIIFLVLVPVICNFPPLIIRSTFGLFKLPYPGDSKFNGGCAHQSVFCLNLTDFK